MNNLPSMITGPAGNLETILTIPANPKNIIGIVCHPHPLFGGTMNNKVVTTIAKVFADLSLITVRFNFRGIGKSEGKYGEAIGEVEDLLAIYDWAKQQYPENKVWLAGFSFGSFIALKASLQRKVAKLILVAPPASNFPFQEIKKIPCEQVIIVQGEQDEVVAPQAVYDWAEQITPKPDLIRLPTATHFFHGQLDVLRNKLIESLKSIII